MGTVPAVIQGRYTIIRSVGQGGMGTVYEAADGQTGATVAVKHLTLNSPESQRAFAREARLLAGLQHPALPRVLDYITEGQDYFLVMEFIAGPDLAERLQVQGRPFALQQALDWADQLLDILEYLHTQAPPVIHRDIKPQNLKLNAAGRIVLLDFGLAKGTIGAQTLAMSSVMGYTAHYAPLEQIQGSGTEPRSDLYALAATLHHLLTGTPPADALTRAAASLNGDPNPFLPAQRVNPAVPAAVGNVLTQAMAQSIKQRFASARMMRLALKNAAVSPAYEGATVAQPKAANASGNAQPSQTASRQRPLMAPLPSPNNRPLQSQGRLPDRIRGLGSDELPWKFILNGLLVLVMIAVLVNVRSRDTPRLNLDSLNTTLASQQRDPEPTAVPQPWQLTYQQVVAFKAACVAGDSAAAANYVVEPISDTVAPACQQIAANSLAYPDFVLGTYAMARVEDGQQHRWPMIWRSPSGERITISLVFEKRFERRDREVYKIVAIEGLDQ